MRRGRTWGTGGVTFVAAGTVGLNRTSSPFRFTQPANTQVGDTLLVSMYVYEGTPTAPAGWTMLASTGNFQVWHRQASAAGTVNHDWTWASSTRISGIYGVYRGLAASPLRSVSTGSGSGTAITYFGNFSPVPNVGDVRILFGCQSGEVDPGPGGNFNRGAVSRAYADGYGVFFLGDLLANPQFDTTVTTALLSTFNFKLGISLALIPA